MREREKKLFSRLDLYKVIRKWIGRMNPGNGFAIDGKNYYYFSLLEGMDDNFYFGNYKAFEKL